MHVVKATVADTHQMTLIWTNTRLTDASLPRDEGPQRSAHSAPVENGLV